MESLDTQALAARLAAVERRLRITTMVWLGVVMVMIVLSVGAERALSQTQALQARSLDIVDANGRTRISLSMSTAGNPAIWIYDANQKTRVYLGLSGSGQPTPQLNLSDENERTRAYLGFGTTGASTPQLGLSDPQGVQRLYVGWSTAENPEFSLTDGSGKTIWSEP